MADTAAHLVDRVFPEVRVRQWVLTLPIALRYRLAYDPRLTSLVLREFVRALSASYRRRARRHDLIRRARGGAVTFLQRFGDALNLNVHFHTLALDGVYLHYGEPRMRFLALPPPEDDEVRRLVERFARRVGRLLERLGLAPCAGWRHRVVPSGRRPRNPSRQACPRSASGEQANSPPEAQSRAYPRRYAWADLLRRVFAVDALECPDCGGHMRILAAIHPPDATRAILECLGLPSRAPPVRPARLEPDELVPSHW